MQQVDQFDKQNQRHENVDRLDWKYVEGGSHGTYLEYTEK